MEEEYRNSYNFFWWMNRQRDLMSPIFMIMLKNILLGVMQQLENSFCETQFKAASDAVANTMRKDQ